MVIRQVFFVTIILWVSVLPRTLGAIPSPLELVRETSEKLLQELRDQRGNKQSTPDELHSLIEQIVLPHFDFERMARLAVGKYWRRASPSQRKRFVEEFQKMLIRTYASSIAKYVDAQIDYLPLRRSTSKKSAMVRAEIVPPDGHPIEVSYSLYLRGEEWKVYDVIVDGVSLVTNYRSTFSREISDSGFDALINKIAQRNEQASR